MITIKEVKSKLEKYAVYEKDNFFVGMLDGKKCFVKIFTDYKTDNIYQMKKNLERTEYIAELFKSNGVNVINAIPYDNQYIHQDGDVLFAVYLWYDGKIYEESLIDNDVCEMIGKLIGKMHALGLKDEKIKRRLKLSTIEYFELDYFCDSKRFDSEIVDGVRKLIEYKEYISLLSKSYEKLVNHDRNILCHRDTGIENFMLYKDTIAILDWERAGYEYPEFELFDTCLEWSGFRVKTDWRKYRSIVRGYYSVVKHSDNVLYEDIFNAMIYSILHRIYQIVLNEKYKKETIKTSKIKAYIYQIDELVNNKNLYIENLLKKEGQ